MPDAEPFVKTRTEILFILKLPLTSRGRYNNLLISVFISLSTLNSVLIHWNVEKLLFNRLYDVPTVEFDPSNTYTSSKLAYLPPYMLRPVIFATGLSKINTLTICQSSSPCRYFSFTDTFN